MEEFWRIYALQSPSTGPDRRARRIDGQEIKAKSEEVFQRVFYAYPVIPSSSTGRARVRGKQMSAPRTTRELASSTTLAPVNYIGERFAR